MFVVLTIGFLSSFVLHGLVTLVTLVAALVLQHLNSICQALTKYKQEAAKYIFGETLTGKVDDSVVVSSTTVSTMAKVTSLEACVFPA